MERVPEFESKAADMHYAAIVLQDTDRFVDFGISEAFRIENDAKNAKSLLSVGCNLGYVEAAIASIFPHLEVDGIERNRWIAEQANQLHSIANFTIRPHTFGEPLGRTYDIVLAEYVLHELPTLEFAVGAIHEALAPGGVFYFTDPNRKRLEDGVDRSDVWRLLDRCRKEEVEPLHADISPKQAQALITDASFRASYTQQELVDALSEQFVNVEVVAIDDRLAGVARKHNE